MNSDVREGFLCPICVLDLGSFHKLQHHFETAHSAEDKAVFDQIKGLFSKAKGRLLKRDELSEASTSQLDTFSTGVFNDNPIWDPQEPGVTRSHVDNFKKIRDARIDRFVIESNKVLIRLDKLLFFEEFDKAKRKEYEQSLVPWVKDADVPYCPTCGDRFNVARRRHHCRLCGAIMCKRCSMFVSFGLAAQLVQTLKRPAVGRRRTQSVLDLSRSPAIEQELNIRCCQECHKLLIKRKDKMDQQANQPLLALLYEKLQNAKISASKFSPEYKKMAESLNQGEEDYDLNKANDMRFKLIKLYETIDVVSKKIAALDTNDEENPPPQSVLRLQRSVRLSSHAYLQENMLTLQSLPSLPKLEILQKERRRENERKLRRQMEEAAKQREAALRRQEQEALEKFEQASATQSTNTIVRTNQTNVVLKEGWSSNVRSTKENYRNRGHLEEQDPITEQITYVKEMISQAQSAGRLEEAKSLFLNLEELERERRRHHVSSVPLTKPTKTQFAAQTRDLNPFLEESDKSVLATNSNPFLSEDEIETNPFLSDNKNSNNNPFLNSDFPSTASANRDSGDPMLQQICYISQCLDEATRLGKRDEVIMLQDNLRDLQAVYNGRYT